MDVHELYTREVDLAITSIKERIERATGADYDELDAVRDTELLLSIEDQLGECHSRCPQFKDVCRSRLVRGKPQICIKKILLELHFPLDWMK